MGPKGEPYTKTNWSTDCRPKDELQIQITDPSSRQTGRYKITNSNRLKENLKEKERLVAGARWAPDTMAEWPTDCRS
jgi:hypothetical protein